MWSFNRARDTDKIELHTFQWQGPFAWINHEKYNNLAPMPEVAGVYLWTFLYKEGYILYSAGVTKSTKKRFRDHTSKFKRGDYTVFNIDDAERGLRNEIWHGWEYAKANKDEFESRKEEILKAVYEQLTSFRVFISVIDEERIRYRMEAAIINNIYNSKEPWSDLADRGMNLRVRFNNEMPILANNIAPFRIYGLPNKLEI